MTHRECSVRTPEGLQLAYHVFGREECPPLLILPGITMPARGMAFVARRLCDRYRVVVPDLRGRGSSDRARPDHHRLSDYSADARHVLADAAAPVEDTVVLGHSLGARIAAFTATSGTTPRGLVLVDPPMSRVGRPYPTTWESFRVQLDPTGEAADLAWVQRAYPSWPAAEQELRLELAPTCDPVAVRETWEHFGRDDFRPLWSALECPTLLITGEDSPMFLDTDLTELRQARPDLLTGRVPGAGHMVPWDNLEGFLELVLPFLSRLTAEPAS